MASSSSLTSSAELGISPWNEDSTEHFTVNGDSISVSKSWLKDCHDNHSGTCSSGTHRSSSAPFFPTRIVDTGPAETVSVVVRQLPPTETSPPPLYATLSHCWGKKQILRLTHETKDMLMTGGVQDTDLPKTFREAVGFVRKLDLQYIWIDSLCIVQDSADDWRHEAALMGKVYSNSALNLAATASADSSGGLNLQKAALISKHLRAELKWPIKSSAGDHVLVPADDYFLLPSDYWSHNVDHAKLNTRGWVLQERLLAPRTLHFTRNQLLWQCSHHRLQEAFPTVKGVGIEDEGKDYTNADLRGFMDHLHHLRTTAEKSGKETEEAYRLWEVMVRRYMCMELTKETDRLVAVQALAQTMEAAVVDQYLAGLWQSNLHVDLLWAIANPTTHHQTQSGTREGVWRAPTWSWASIEGSFINTAWMAQYKSTEAVKDWSLIRLLRADIQGFDGSTTGQLQSARLHLRGLLLHSTVEWKTTSWTFLQHTEIYALVARDAEGHSAATGVALTIVPDVWQGRRADQMTEVFLPKGALLLGVRASRAPDGEQVVLQGLMLQSVQSSPEDDGKEGPMWAKRKGYFEMLGSVESIVKLRKGRNEIFQRIQDAGVGAKVDAGTCEVVLV